MSLGATLLRPASVALLGASGDSDKTAARPLIYLRRNGFAGNIYPVNPRREKVLGERAWPSIESLPQTPDHVFVLTATEEVPTALRDCVSRQVPLVTVLASGYGEQGDEGRARETELRNILAGSRTRLLGPNSIGVVNPHVGLTLTANAAFAESDLPRGGLFVASHSGSMIGALLSRGKVRGIGFSGFVSVGSEVDLSLGEICSAVLDEPTVEVYALFLESIRHGAALRRFAIAAAARGKPIIAYKLGRSAQAAELAQSHTGAIAGEDGIADAYLKECGIARVDTLEALLEAPALARRLGMRTMPQPPRVAVVSTTGGGGAMIVDQLGVRGVEAHAPSGATLQQLRSRGVVAAPGRIVDLTLAGTKPEIMSAALQTLLQAPEFDVVVAVAGSSARFQPEILVPAIVNAALGSDKAFAAFVAPEAAEALAQLTAAGLPCFRTPESCADAIAAVCTRRRPKSFAETAVQGAEVQLDEAQGYAVLADLGILAATHAVVGPGALRSPLPYPVAVKLLSSAVLHKSELGGVELGVSDDAAFRQALARILGAVAAAAPGIAVERFLVQRMSSGIGEVLLSFRRDVHAGALVMLAAGGIFAEIYKDRSIRLAPVTRDEARAMIAEVRSLRAMTGYRGRPRGDLDALADAIVALSHAGGGIIEAEINPLLVGYEGSGVTALDAVVRLSGGQT